MESKKIFIIVWLIMVAIVAMLVFPIMDSNFASNKLYEVKRINVLSGNEFDIILKEGQDFRRLRCVLTVRTPPEAKEKVIQILDKATITKVLIKDNRYRSSDILFVIDGEEYWLTHWLKSNNLVWE